MTSAPINTSLEMAADRRRYVRRPACCRPTGAIAGSAPSDGKGEEDAGLAIIHPFFAVTVKMPDGDHKRGQIAAAGARW